MDNIRLKKGIFKTSQDKGREFLNSLDVDRLLAPYYETCEQKPKKKRYGGWEGREIGGHSLGHFLSAASLMYRVTEDQNLKAKVDYAVTELAYLQSIDIDSYLGGVPKTIFEKVFAGDFHVDRFHLAGYWVPWYNLHKLIAGLIDAFRFAGNLLALKVVSGLADWAAKGTSRLSDTDFQKMLACEYGGMNEAFADLYSITGKDEYLLSSIRFSDLELLEALAEGENVLTGLHANTQIPKVIGYAKLYEITKEEKYRQAAEFFWNDVVGRHSYVFGGNSKGEHFLKRDNEVLGVDTAETCNTYNMLKLTEILYSWELDSKYIDYYEKALYNHILASQDPDTGLMIYFLPTEPGHFKTYCTREDSFWCCTGTGMENPARYNRAPYFRNNDDIYVNMLIPSLYESKEKGVRILLETKFPEAEEVCLRILEAFSEFNLFIRKPSWVARNVNMRINGETIDCQGSKGYLKINRRWKRGDIIRMRLPMEVSVHRTLTQKKIAFKYGPLVLAGALGKENYPTSDYQEDQNQFFSHPLIEVPKLAGSDSACIKRVRELVFEADGTNKEKIKLIPLYSIHHERYAVYWDFE